LATARNTTITGGAVAKPEVRRNISEFQAQVAGAAVPNQSS